RRRYSPRSDGAGASNPRAAQRSGPSNNTVVFSGNLGVHIHGKPLSGNGSLPGGRETLAVVPAPSRHVPVSDPVAGSGGPLSRPHRPALLPDRAAAVHLDHP